MQFDSNVFMSDLEVHQLSILLRQMTSKQTEEIEVGCANEQTGKNAIDAATSDVCSTGKTLYHFARFTLTIPSRGVPMDGLWRDGVLLSLIRKTLRASIVFVVCSCTVAR